MRDVSDHPTRTEDVARDRVRAWTTAVRQRERKVHLRVHEIGVVAASDAGIAWVEGLPHVTSGEMVRIGGDGIGTVFELQASRVGVVTLTTRAAVFAGTTVTRLGHGVTVPTGPAIVGRTITPLGGPLDGRPLDVTSQSHGAAERAPVPLNLRGPIAEPLHTGVKIVDALVPIGHGQRELILGSRRTGKTLLTLQAVLAQRGRGVRCIVCRIGQRAADTVRVLEVLRRSGALAYTTVVVAGSDDPPGLRRLAPFAAMAMAEAVMDGGGKALVVLDDLTHHARAHRELSLLLGRPPGREAYPGDVFHLHARLLERAARRSDEAGGGSITVLAVAETDEGALTAFIPTNLIGIADGQIVTDADRAARGEFPAIDLGRSVSRVGGRAQPRALALVAGRTRTAQARFEDLERLTRFATDARGDARRTLERGRRVRWALRQGALDTMGVPEQVADLWAATQGAYDALDEEGQRRAMDRLHASLRNDLVDVRTRLDGAAGLPGGPSLDDDLAAIVSTARHHADAVMRSKTPRVISEEGVATEDAVAGTAGLESAGREASKGVD